MIHWELPRSVRPAGAEISEIAASEEGRALLQRRLSSFGLCWLALAGGSWLLQALAYGWGARELLWYSPLSPSGVLQLSSALVTGGLWWELRRQRRTARQLQALDAGVLLALTLLWAPSLWLLPQATGSFVALLSFVLGVLARSILVPSTAWRTLALSLPGAALLALSALAAALWSQLAAAGALTTLIGALSATGIAMLASHTLFGLRRELQRARALGHYTLETKIGAGSLGEVWRGSHALLRRPTAIKLLAPGRVEAETLTRFERDVQRAARLTHPSAVAIYDYGRTRDGVFYYVMELLEGIDLEQLVQEDGPQPAERVVQILVQLCGALAEAHELGLIHRDIKPANVLLCARENDREFAKLLDFGLVKTLHPHPESGIADAAMTGIDTLTGTPLYMSPEAIRAPDTVDARSDLYALGALAWHLLVGHPPFEANNMIEVCGQHLHAVPRRPSVALRASVPSDLEDIVLSCLEKRPEDRPASARELRRLLEGCEIDQRWSAERSSEWWRARASFVPVSETPASSGQTLAPDLSARELAEPGLAS